MLQQLLLLLKDKELAKALAIGLIALVIERVAKMAYHTIVELAAASHSFRISGFWAASFYNEQAKCTKYELVRIKQRGDEVRCTFLQFNSANDDVEWLGAVGVIRGASIATVYFPASSEQAGIGALVLAVRTKADEKTVLAGQWMEFRNVNGSEVLTNGGEEYVLHRVKLGLGPRLRFALRRRCVDGPQEFTALLGLHPAKSPAATPARAPATRDQKATDVQTGV